MLSRTNNFYWLPTIMSESNQDIEYIKSLEESIDYLKSELDKLRQSSSAENKRAIEEFPEDKMPEPLFHLCASSAEVETLLFEFISHELKALEAVFIKLDDHGKPVVFAMEAYNVSLKKNYDGLIESGVAEWLFQNSGPVMIPSLKDENTSKPTSLILAPLDSALGKFVFIAKSPLPPRSEKAAELERISRVAFTALLRLQVDKLRIENEFLSQNTGIGTLDYPLLLQSRIRHHINRSVKGYISAIESNAQLIKKQVGDVGKRSEGLIRDAKAATVISDSENGFIDLERFVYIWGLLLQNEGIHIVASKGEGEALKSLSPKLLLLADMIVEFSYPRYEDRGEIKLFGNKNLEKLLLTVKTQSMHLGVSEPITNDNYREATLPSDLMRIFVITDEIGYYLTITEEAGSTYYEIHQR